MDFLIENSICLFFILIFVKVFFGKNLKFLNSMFFNIVLILFFLFLAVYFLGEYSIFSNEKVILYIDTSKKLIQLLLWLLGIGVTLFVLIGFFGKRYSLRVDNFNIGGINIFFDKSFEIYTKAVGSFLATKRSIVCFDERFDNIDEVLNSYYSIYEFIRENLQLLDPVKDEDIYEISTNMLGKLNQFLTKNQNDYRRWYKNVVEKDTINHGNKVIIVHATNIEDVQKCYYRYDAIIKDFKDINEFFKSNEIEKIFKIKSYDWRVE
ncbi:hypothetical protein [Carnobacterium maltaromaticum]|uniref:hypothetical protein n=1 Tax=Carnobacterium maltaromaticum TaxID=2751 RepID=UPI00295E6819|nr:hypothetical protein [Carnobacterium maltaromaticum]